MGTLLNRRRYMGGGASLPYDAEIEYLESTGTQWIDLGFKATGNIQFEFRVNRATDDIRFHCGAEQGWSSKVATFVFINGSKTYWRYGDSSVGSGDQLGASSNFVGDVEVIVDKNVVTARNERTSYSTTNTLSGGVKSFTTPGNFILFGVTVAGEPQSDITMSGSRLYSFKVVDDGVNLDLIPVRIGQVGYLYDKNSGRLFGKSGEDDFVLGNDVTKGYDYQVEYIQLNSRSSQLINTGIWGDMGTDAVEVKFGNVSKENQDIFIGDNSGTDTRAIRLYINSSSKYAFYYRSTSNADTWNSTDVDSANGVETTFKVDYKNGTWSIDNGTQYSGTFSCNAYNSYYNTVGSKFGNRSAPAKYYYVRWWRNDVLILHAIPVVKNGTPYFYDIVNNKLINIYAAVSNITIGSRI